MNGQPSRPLIDADDFRRLLANCRAAFEQRLSDAHFRARMLLAHCQGMVARFDKKGDACYGDTVERRIHERHLKAVVDLIAEFEHVTPRQETPDEVPTATNRARWLPTAETVAKQRRRRDPIVNLVRHEVITSEQAAAARKIALIVQVISACQGARAQNLDRVGGGGNRIDSLPESIAIDHHDVYLPWTIQLRVSKRHRNHLDIVLKVCVDGYSLDDIKPMFRMGHRRALVLFRYALDLFIDYQERASRARDVA